MKTVRFKTGLNVSRVGAGNCIECGECEETCPYHLPIREMLREKIEIYERAMMGA